MQSLGSIQQPTAFSAEHGVLCLGVSIVQSIVPTLSGDVWHCVRDVPAWLTLVVGHALIEGPQIVSLLQPALLRKQRLQEQ
jgi:hypothetical protein